MNRDITTIDKVMDTYQRLLGSVNADEIKILSSVLKSQITKLENKLKALKIIADKCIDVLHLNRCRTYGSYRNKSYDNVSLEEYNFLRKILWGYPARKK